MDVLKCVSADKNVLCDPQKRTQRHSSSDRASLCFYPSAQGTLATVSRCVLQEKHKLQSLRDSGEYDEAGSVFSNELLLQKL